jgi:uncharacterized Zn finger protein
VQTKEAAYKRVWACKHVVVIVLEHAAEQAKFRGCHRLDHKLLVVAHEKELSTLSVPLRSTM